MKYAKERIFEVCVGNKMVISTNNRKLAKSVFRAYRARKGGKVRFIENNVCNVYK